MAADKLSIKELKQILIDAKVPIPSGIEKPELVALAQAVLLAKPKDEKQYIRVREFGAKLAECEAIFVFFHGYGADENQFAFFERYLSKTVCVVCPKSADEGECFLC